MGTKNNPSKFDCYANAEPDEPMFILLARDRRMPAFVWLWAVLRELDGEKEEVAEEARDVARDGFKWAMARGREPEGILSVLKRLVDLPSTAISSLLVKIEERDQLFGYYLTGYKAYQAGHARESNPETDEMLAWIWERGWLHGQEETGKESKADTDSGKGDRNRAKKTLTEEKVREASETRYGMLNGLAKQFLEATGLGPEQAELVEEMKGTGLTWRFRKIGEP